MKQETSSKKIDSLPKLSLVVPDSLLADKDLTPNDKIVLSFNYSLMKKQGYNAYTIKRTGEILNMHPNSLTVSIKYLLKLNYLVKMDGELYITKEIKEKYAKDKRYLKIPPEVYRLKMNSGAKLLWGEFNSMSKNGRQYKARRIIAVRKMNVDESTISRWTKVLENHGLFKDYHLQSGKNSKQRVVVTKDLRFEKKKSVETPKQAKPKIKDTQPTVVKELDTDNVFLKQFIDDEFIEDLTSDCFDELELLYERIVVQRNVAVANAAFRSLKAKVEKIHQGVIRDEVLQNIDLIAKH